MTNSILVNVPLKFRDRQDVITRLQLQQGLQEIFQGKRVKVIIPEDKQKASWLKDKSFGAIILTSSEPIKISADSQDGLLIEAQAMAQAG